MSNPTSIELETIEPTPEEMEKRIARFKDLKPTKRNYNESNVSQNACAYENH